MTLVQRGCSGTKSAEVTGEEHRFSNVFGTCEFHQNPFNPESPSGVGRNTVAESSHVKFEFFGVKVHISQVFHEHVNAVLTLTTGGHFIPAKVEVKTPGELCSCAPNLALDLVDVKGFEGHGPAGKEIELRKVLSKKVRVLRIDVVAPLDGPAFFLDDANGVVVFHAWEGQFRHDHFDQLLALFGPEGVDGGDELLGLFLFCDRLPDVVEHAFEDAHHVVIVGP